MRSVWLIDKMSLPLAHSHSNCRIEWASSKYFHASWCLVFFLFFLKLVLVYSQTMAVRVLLSISIDLGLFHWWFSQWKCLLQRMKRPYAWWRFADQFHHQAASHSKCKCSPEDRNWKEYQHEMWKKRAETTWERGVVVKLISKTSSCRRPIGVRDSVHVADVDMTWKQQVQK